MTTILSWNIQNGKGADGVISLERIAAVINAMCDPDIICLQEVSRHLPLTEDGPAPDNIAGLSALFPGYETIFGVGVEASQNSAEPRWQFGNVTLTRLPILSVFHHALPQPAESGVRHMPRQAIEVTVATARGPLRVVNAHLEFHSANQRLAQIERLRYIHEEIVSRAQAPGNHEPSGPYQKVARSEDCVMCGDFNIETDFDEYGALLAPGKASFHDAWRIVHADRPHDATCGIHDQAQWPQGPHCRDYFFVTDAISREVREVTVDKQTNASDHQPLMLRLVKA